MLGDLRGNFSTLCSFSVLFPLLKLLLSNFVEPLFALDCGVKDHLSQFILYPLQFYVFQSNPYQLFSILALHILE